MAIEIVSQNDCLVVDSRLIADELGIEHRALRQTIEKYINEIQEFGVVTFFQTKPLEGSSGGRPERYCYLNKEQSQIIISKSRNGLRPDGIERFREMGFDFSMFPYLERKRSKTKESDYSNALAKKNRRKKRSSYVGWKLRHFNFIASN